MIKTRTGEWSPNSPFQQKAWNWVQDGIEVRTDPVKKTAIYKTLPKAKIGIESFTYVS